MSRFCELKGQKYKKNILLGHPENTDLKQLATSGNIPRTATF